MANDILAGLEGLKGLNVKGFDWEKLNNLSETELRELLRKFEAMQSISFKDYVPHPKQHEFHASPCLTRLLLGGNRSGKTRCGFQEDMWHLTGEYPDWYRDEQRLIPPVMGRYVATDFKKGVGGVFQPYFESLIPKHYVRRVQKTQQGIVEKVFFKNGSILDIMTHEQDIDVFEGWHGHFVHFDEPPPRNRYIACKRGLVDFNGRCWFTLTPLSEPWVYDELYDNEDNTIFVVTVNIRDNPYLKEASILEFEKTLTDDEREARIKGKFMHLSGVIYKEFDKNVHVIEDFEIPIDWRRIQAIDPHDRKPHAIGWYCVDPYDNIYIYDELEFAGTVPETSAAIKTKEGSNPAHIRIIDPNKGRAPSAVGKKGMLADEFAKEGLRYNSKVNDSLADGHLLVKKYLMYDRSKPTSLVNRPKLFVFKSCKEHIRAFTHYIWDEFRNPDGKDPKERPKQLRKDFMDLVRYVVMSKPTYKKFVSTVHRSKSITGY